jgi:hypothetical protein
MQITISADSLSEFISTIGELHGRLNAASVPPPYEKLDVLELNQDIVDPGSIFGQSDARPLNAGVDVDLDGLPWDGRIHASSRAKLANGKWRPKRGVTDAQVATIQAELRQTWNSNPAAAPVLETATVTQVIPPPVPTGVDPFLTLMKGVTAGYANGSISAERIQDILAPLGIPSLPMLTQRPDLIPAVATAFGIAI